MRPIENIKSRLKGTIIDEGEDGFREVFSTGGKSFRYQFSWGGEWEHASISIGGVDYIREKETPTWKEMCMFKDIFWDEDETVIQYHPAKTVYVNVHKGCLHLWRPTELSIPTPPINFV